MNDFKELSKLPNSVWLLSEDEKLELCDIIESALEQYNRFLREQMRNAGVTVFDFMSTKQYNRYTELLENSHVLKENKQRGDKN